MTAPRLRLAASDFPLSLTTLPTFAHLLIMSARMTRHALDVQFEADLAKAMAASVEAEKEEKKEQNPKPKAKSSKGISQQKQSGKATAARDEEKPDQTEPAADANLAPKETKRASRSSVRARARTVKS